MTNLDIRQSILRPSTTMAGAAGTGADQVLLSHDAEIAKLYEDRNITLTDGGEITFTGTQVQFTEPLNLTINQNVAGGAPVVISLGLASQTFSYSGDILYATINRTAGTATLTVVSPGGSSGVVPAPSNSDLEVFLICKRKDDADGTQRLYFRSGAALSAGQTCRLGAGGVTNVATGTGLTGGPIINTGTISLAPVNNNTLLANTSGASAAPVPTTLSSMIDSAASNVVGSMLYRGSTGWSALPPGSAGQVLALGNTTNPEWSQPTTGLKNYLTNGNFETGATTGWSLAHTALNTANGYALPTSVAAAGTAFSATAGGTAAAAALSLSVTSSGQLAGLYSGSLASSAASTAGDCLVSSAFTIDSEDQAKVLTVKFYYSVPTGASALNFSGTSSNSFAVWIYDVTNGAWIMPAGCYSMTQGSGAGYATATFQTTSNSTQYQLALVNINASTAAYTIYVDDVSVSPVGPAPQGAIITAPMQYTPTFGNFGTVTDVNMYSYRCGKFLVVYGSFKSGTTAAAAATMSIGFNGANQNVSIDFNNALNGGNDTGGVAGANGNELIGSYTITTANNTSGWMVTYGNNPSLIGFGQPFANTAIEGQVTNSNAISGSNQRIIVSPCFVPIVGWGGTTAMSSDTDTRVISARAPLAANSSMPTNATTIIGFSPATYDPTGSLGSNAFKVPVTGIYKVTANAGGSGSNMTAGYGVDLYLYKNGSNYSTMGRTPTFAGSYYVSVAASDQVYALAGDSLQIAFNPETGGTFNFSGGQVIFERLSGPAVVAATESVSASYYCSANFTASATVPINFDTKVWDSHSAVTTSATAWHFTAPVPGKFLITGQASGGSQYAMLYKNGAQYMTIGAISVSSGTEGSFNGTVALLAGDYIDIRPTASNTVTGGALSAQGVTNIQITKIAN